MAQKIEFIYEWRNGKFTEHAKGKKTDLKDSRWIQKLHSPGLLTSSFLPDETIEILLHIAVKEAI